MSGSKSTLIIALQAELEKPLATPRPTLYFFASPIPFHSMINRDIYENDPKQFHLLNNGVAKVRDSHSEEELRTLRFELQTFICEGQFEKGMVRLLRSYLDNLSQPEQPAAWVSGFFGSGKSHLVKMLRYLWVDYEFPDGATARGLANLPPKVDSLLKELSTHGRRLNGLHSASGTLGSSKRGSVRLALLSIIYRSLGLPEKYALAEFVLWTRQEGIYEDLRRFVESESEKDWSYELRNLAKSTPIAEGLLQLKPSLGDSASDVHQLLKNDHPPVKDVSLDDMTQSIRDALEQQYGGIPCTLVALDEIQQFIGSDSDRTYKVQEVTQACTSEFKGKLMFVATGQTSLNGTPELEKLTGRYRIQIALSDAEVETVTRKTVLKKKASAREEVETTLTRNSGEISRHLSDTDFAAKPEDKKHIVNDYPLLPTRRRFWERVLRAVDEAGTQSQLRTQLKVVDEAVKQTADEELGTVVGGDFIYLEQRSNFLQSGVLSNDIDARIERLREEEEDELGARLSALAFLIGKLPREGTSDTGLRATPETFADLLVEDLGQGSGPLRTRIEERLKDLEAQGLLMEVDGEYRMQTRESQEWMNEYRGHYTEITKQREQMASERSQALRQAAQQALNDVAKVKHGSANERRAVSVHFSRSEPEAAQDTIPAWVRDEWATTLSSVEDDARKAGHDKALIYVFLPKRSADALDKAIAEEKAAQTTLDVKGRTTTRAGKEAQQAMRTRLESAKQRKEAALNEITGGARVFLAGGQEYVDDTVAGAVEEAAANALERMYPKFGVADHAGWGRALRRALDGDKSALEAVDFNDNPEKHSVCDAILKNVNSITKGKTVRDTYTTAPYGWPQDAVDTALVLLTLTNHVRARRSGEDLDATDLTQRSIGATQFRAETVQISRAQRIQIRGILDSFVDVSPEEELAAIGAFIDSMERVVRSASGAPPLPEKPDLDYLSAIKRASGNEKLAAFFEHKDQVQDDLDTWQSMKNRKASRQEQWQQLNRAVRFGDTLDTTASVQREMQAIKDSRSLLNPDNPVQAPLSTMTAALRDALVDLRSRYEDAYNEHRDTLEATEVWTQLDDDTQTHILQTHALAEVPDIETGNTDAVLRSLGRMSLDNWRARLDALPGRFDTARAEAAQHLEPDTVRVRLDSEVLKTEDDVEAWIENARARLLEEVQEHPVQV